MNQPYDDMEEGYQRLRKPSNFVRTFDNDFEFIAWAMEGTASDLRACIQEFAQDSLYWHCEVLEQVLIRMN